MVMLGRSLLLYLVVASVVAVPPASAVVQEVLPVCTDTECCVNAKDDCCPLTREWLQWETDDWFDCKL